MSRQLLPLRFAHHGNAVGLGWATARSPAVRRIISGDTSSIKGPGGRLRLPPLRQSHRNAI